MSEIKRKKSESFEAFMRRVKRTWVRSGKILQARKIQFYKKKPSKNVQKNTTVFLAQKHSKLTYLRKIGRLPAEELNPRKRRRR